MALGSEGFFSPEGLQGGESRGGEKGEWPFREVGRREQWWLPLVSAPPPFSKGPRVCEEVPACLCCSEGGPVLSYRLLLFARGQLIEAQLAVRGTCSLQSSPRSATDAGYWRPAWSP